MENLDIVAVIFFFIFSFILNIIFITYFQKYLIYRVNKNKQEENLSLEDTEYSSQIFSHPIDYKSNICLFLFLVGTYYLFITSMVILYMSVLFLPLCFYFYYIGLRKIEITSKGINIYRYYFNSDILVQDILFENIRGVKFIYTKTFLGVISKKFNKKDMFFLLKDNTSFSLQNIPRHISIIVFDFLDLNKKSTIVLLKDKVNRKDEKMKTIVELSNKIHK